ncbi:MAG: AraC family transcriptional regulator [Clostridiales bacterium]|nr:AraC family transcriptional regulator [Clostridiales bacterium]
MKTSITEIRSSSDENYLMCLFYAAAKPSKRGWREHHHTELEISLVKEGHGTYTVKDRSFEFKPGDIFLFGTHEEHYITDIDEEILLLNIHFEPRFIWANSNEMFDAKYLKIFFDRSYLFENRLDRDNPATETIRELILGIESEVNSQSAEYELMVKVKLLTILVLLIREYNYVNRSNSYTERANLNKISNAMRFLDENITEPLSLDEIAEKANLNKTYFITLFKKLNGVTPWEYITARRIEKSYELLRRGNMNVLEIATLCGFNNASNFNRAFRKVTGVTPSEFRKSDIRKNEYQKNHLQ